MEYNIFDLNNNIYSYNNSKFLEIINNLNKLISYTRDDLIIKTLGDVIYDINTIINKNKKNLEIINNEISSLYNRLNELSEKITINNINNKELKFRNGKYVGETLYGLPEGKGIWYGNNGDRYQGDWKMGLCDGIGIKYFKNGDRFEGEFRNDLKEGKGIIYFNNGDRYEGDWKNDEQEGKGIYYYNNGDRYEGDYKNGKKDGRGIYFNKRGDRKMGDYLKGEPIGKHVKLKINGKVEIKEY